MSTTLSKSDFDLSQIINGVTIMEPSPFGYHQDISGNLYFLLRKYTKTSLTGKIFSAPLDVIFEDGLNVVHLYKKRKYVHL